MAWSPLAGGALFSSDHPDIMSALSNVALQNNVDETAVAIAWLLAHPSRILPVLGTNSLDRIKGMSAALDVKMDRQTWYEIYTAALGREVA
jgi:predicted oxidoreductase